MPLTDGCAGMEQVVKDFDSALFYLETSGLDTSDIYFLINDKFKMKFKSNVNKIVVKTGNGKASRIFSEQIKVPFVLRRYGIKRVFSLCNISPVFFGGTQYVMVHDLHWFHKKEFFSGLKDRLRVLYVTVGIAISVIRAKRVYTGSPHAAMDIFSIFNVKTRVFSWGVKRFFLSPPISQDIEKFNLKKKFILFVGQTHRRKNVITLLKALKSYGIPDLVIAGSEGDGEAEIVEYIEKNNLSQRVIRRKSISKEELKVLYSKAEAFIYPSLYEGFGLPILEAMACGCPVVTSNSSCLPYTAAGAAVIVDSEDEVQIALGIEKAINEKQLYAELGKKRIGNLDSLTTTTQLIRDIVQSPEFMKSENGIKL